MVKKLESLSVLARGNYYFQQGELTQAEKYCAELLKESPEHPEVLCLQGMIARQQGDSPAAVQFITKALELQPQNTDFWNQLGLAIQNLGHHQEAINLYRQGLQFNPCHGELLVNLALALAAKGNNAEAQANFQKALKTNQDNPVLKDTYATYLACRGQGEAAIQQWRGALQSDRNYWPAAFKMGVFYFEKGDFAKAITHLENATRLNPTHEQSYFYLAHSHRRNKQTDLELATYRRLIEEKPDSVFGYTRLGICYEAYGQIAEAAEIYSCLAELQFQDRFLWEVRRNSLMSAIPESNDVIDMERSALLNALEAARQDPAGSLALAQVFEARCYSPSTLVYQGRDDMAIKNAYADWLVEKLDIPVYRPRLSSVAGRKIRIGFLLTENHERVFKRVMGGYLKFLNREMFDVQIICQATRMRGMQSLLSEIPDLTYITLPGELEPSVTTLNNAQLDVLFYFEIGTDPRNYLLSLYRFAPVQCTSWGFPSTSGSPNIDYYISSRLIEPDNAQTQYRETLLLMDHLPCYTSAPQLPERYKSRLELNLPENKNLYVCAQTLIKFHPDFDDILIRILKSDPNGEVILVEGLHSIWTNALKERLQKRMQHLFERIHFLPQLGMEDYLSLLNAADVVLDTPHFGGGLTTYETLAVGTPLVTLVGASMRGRYGLGCYQAMEMTELIANSVDDYVNLALHVATDPIYREQLRQTIRARNSILFEDMAVIRDMETLLLHMVHEAEHR